MKISTQVAEDPVSPLVTPVPVELVQLPDKGSGRDGLTAILFADDGRTPGSVNFIASWHQINPFILCMHTCIKSGGISPSDGEVPVRTSPKTNRPRIQEGRTDRLRQCNTARHKGRGGRKAFSVKSVIKKPFDFLKELAVWQLQARKKKSKGGPNGNEKSLAHTRWNYGEKRRVIGAILRKLCEWKNVNILEAECCVH